MFDLRAGLDVLFSLQQSVCVRNIIYVYLCTLVSGTYISLQCSIVHSLYNKIRIKFIRLTH